MGIGFIELWRESPTQAEREAAEQAAAARAQPYAQSTLHNKSGAAAEPPRTAKPRAAPRPIEGEIMPELARFLTPEEKRTLAEHAPHFLTAPPGRYARQRRYHDAHMRTVSCKVQRTEAESFEKLCERYGVTRHIALAAYIDRCCIEGELVAGVDRLRGTW